jgi:hypothetical protein
MSELRISLLRQKAEDKGAIGFIGLRFLGYFPLSRGEIQRAGSPVQRLI